MPLVIMGLVSILSYYLENDNISGKGLMCNRFDYPIKWDRYIRHQKENLTAIYFLSPDKFITKFIRLGANPELQQNGVFNYTRFKNEITFSVMHQNSVINTTTGVWTSEHINHTIRYQCSKFLSHRKLDQEMQKQLVKQ